jgi:RNA polymerase sigma-70 factor (ECF subfamily)
MELNDHNDEKVLQELALGSEKAFTLIYDRYYYAVARTGMKYLQDTKLTEDLIQEIFTKIWTHRTQFTGVQHFQSYLYTMVKNLALLYIKNVAREVAAKENFSRRKAESENNIDNYLTEKEYDHLVAQAIAELPVPHQKVFKLAKLEGINRSEIAERLKLSQQTVDNYLVLAVKSIKNRLRHVIVSPCLIAALYFLG